MKTNINITNKKAKFDYIFIAEYVAGIKLKGAEIKSIREKLVSFSDSFVFFKDNEVFLKNLHIAPYKNSELDAKRDRKLLLTKRELKKLRDKSRDNGLTIIPYRIFINEKGLAKVVIVLVKGKKVYDKREFLKQKEIERQLRREEY